jgi:NADPH2:quinone reductase
MKIFQTDADNASQVALGLRQEKTSCHIKLFSVQLQVGLAACQLAHAAGLTDFGSAGTPAGSETVMKTGAKHVFNHRESGYIDKILVRH